MDAEADIAVTGVRFGPAIKSDILGPYREGPHVVEDLIESWIRWWLRTDQWEFFIEIKARSP